MDHSSTVSRTNIAADRRGELGSPGPGGGRCWRKRPGVASPFQQKLEAVGRPASARSHCRHGAFLRAERPSVQHVGATFMAE